MGWSLTVLFVGFLCLLGVSIPNCDDWQERYLHLVLMLIVLANVGVNVLQGNSFHTKSRPPKILQDNFRIIEKQLGIFFEEKVEMKRNKIGSTSISKLTEH